METRDSAPSQPEKSININRVIGIILLVPPSISVLLFCVNLFVSKGNEDIVGLDNLSQNWTGSYSGNGGGFTSAAPIYFGLMAIAGAILLSFGNRDSTEKM